MLYSVPYISELEKRSVKNDCSGSAKSSRFDFTIANNDFEDLQAGYQPKTTICNTDGLQREWCRYLRAHFEVAVNDYPVRSITNPAG